MVEIVEKLLPAETNEAYTAVVGYMAPEKKVTSEGVWHSEYTQIKTSVLFLWPEMAAGAYITVAP